MKNKFNNLKTNLNKELDFIIKKLREISPGLSDQEIGFYVVSGFNLFSSLYEKFSRELLVMIQEVYLKKNRKTPKDYTLCFSYRNELSKENERNMLELINEFNDKYSEKNNCISSSFVSKNKGLDKISIISLLLDVIASEKKINHLESKFDNNDDKKILSLIDNLESLENTLKSNYKVRTNAAHGGFRTLEAFSTSNTLSNSIEIFVQLKLYILVIEEIFNKYIIQEEIC